MTQKHRFGIEKVDMKKSTINKEKSDEKRGVYTFKKKVLYTPKPSDGYAYKWVQTRPENIQKWQYSHKADFVTVGDDVYPAPLAVNADGHYQMPGGDLVLMKIPMDIWLDKRVKEKRQSDKEARGAIRSFEKMVSKQSEKYGSARLTKEEKERVGI